MCNKETWQSWKGCFSTQTKTKPSPPRLEISLVFILSQPIQTQQNVSIKKLRVKYKKKNIWHKKNQMLNLVLMWLNEPSALFTVVLEWSNIQTSATCYRAAVGEPTCLRQRGAQLPVGVWLSWMCFIRVLQIFPVPHFYNEELEYNLVFIID